MVSEWYTMVIGKEMNIISLAHVISYSKTFSYLRLLSFRTSHTLSSDHTLDNFRLLSTIHSCTLRHQSHANVQASWDMMLEQVLDWVFLGQEILLLWKKSYFHHRIRNMPHSLFSRTLHTESNGRRTHNFLLCYTNHNCSLRHQSHANSLVNWHMLSAKLLFQMLEQPLEQTWARQRKDISLDDVCWKWKSNAIWMLTVDVGAAVGLEVGMFVGAEVGFYNKTCKFRN